MQGTKFREIIERNFSECGFDAAAVLPFALLQADQERFSRWVEAGMDGGPDGGMGYLGRSVDYRGDLRRLMPDVRSVVVTLTSYRRVLEQPSGVPRIARFAWSDDYHPLIKGRLATLGECIKREADLPKLRFRAVVDSAPALERAWAARAGLGWIGRSSMLVNRTLGSYTLIGLLLLDEPIGESTAYDESFDAPLEESTKYDGLTAEVRSTSNYSRDFPTDISAKSTLALGCGSCRRCVESCPTGAIVADGVVDARRCLAYHTIESAIEPTAEVIEDLGRHSDGGPRIFGCDACLEACPYNRSAPAGCNMPLRESATCLTRDEWLAMSEVEFTARFAGSPLLRAGLDRIQRLLRVEVR